MFSLIYLIMQKFQASKDWITFWWPPSLSGTESLLSLSGDLMLSGVCTETKSKMIMIAIFFSCLLHAIWPVHCSFMAKPHKDLPWCSQSQHWKKLHKWLTVLSAESPKWSLESHQVYSQHNQYRNPPLAFVLLERPFLRKTVVLPLAALVSFPTSPTMPTGSWCFGGCGECYYTATRHSQYKKVRVLNQQDGVDAAVVLWIICHLSVFTCKVTAVNESRRSQSTSIQHSATVSWDCCTLTKDDFTD